MHKSVLIIKGSFKGQRGIVTKVNGDDALVELSTRTKKISIPKVDVVVIEGDDQETFSYQP